MYGNLILGCGDANDGSKTLPEAKQILLTVLVNA